MLGWRGRARRDARHARRHRVAPVIGWGDGLTAQVEGVADAGLRAFGRRNGQAIREWTFMIPLKAATWRSFAAPGASHVRLPISCALPRRPTWRETASMHRGR